MEEDIEVEGEMRKVKVYGRYRPEKEDKKELNGYVSVGDLVSFPIAQGDLREGVTDWTFNCANCEESCHGIFVDKPFKKGDWVRCPLCNQLGWQADFDLTMQNNFYVDGQLIQPVRFVLEEKKHK